MSSVVKERKMERHRLVLKEGEMDEGTEGKMEGGKEEWLRCLVRHCWKRGRADVMLLLVKKKG